MQEVFICPECHKDHDGSFKAGDVPKALIPHSPASASAVAYVMFHKTFMGLPYYRMESAFEQLGAKIPRETMANWCIIAAREYLLPIFERLHAEIIKRDILCADETTCQVLHEEGRDASPHPICGFIPVIPTAYLKSYYTNTSPEEQEHSCL